MTVDVCIIGAGISGLTAGLLLVQKGLDVCIVDAQNRVGGRIQTDVVEGYLCDRGFQVLLPAYPSARKLLDYQALSLKPYPKGAVTISDCTEWFGAPFMYPKQWQLGQRLSTRYRDWISFATEFLQSPYPTQINDEISSMDYFLHRYSEPIVTKFLQPFFSGVFLDLNCTASPQLFRYYWRLFAMSGAAIPANGMGAIPQQLAAAIPDESIHCSSKVVQLDANDVLLENGTRIVANKVVFACDQLGVSQLMSGVEAPVKTRPVSTYFFSTDSLDGLGPLTFVLGASMPIQISIPTLVQPSYSDNGDHLLMVSCVGGHPNDPGAIFQALRDRIGEQVNQWTFIHYHHIEYALPTNRCEIPVSDGYYYCGDWGSFGSIESAMRSGIQVANLIL